MKRLLRLPFWLGHGVTMIVVFAFFALAARAEADLQPERAPSGVRSAVMGSVLMASTPDLEVSEEEAAKAEETAGEPPPPEEAKEEASPAPGQFEVDKDAAERALERTLVVTGALLLPLGKAEIQPSFVYIRSEQGFPAFFFDEDLQFAARQSHRRNLFVGDFTLRFGLPFDSQLEVGIPYQYAEQQNVTTVGLAVAEETTHTASGLGDIRVGLAKGLLHEKGWWPNLIGRATWSSSTGQTDDEILFSGFNSLEGSLTAIKSQDPLVFIGDVSYERFFRENDFTLGDSLSFSVGALLAASPETSLRVILNQSFLDEVKVGNRTIPGTNQVIGTLNFGASSILGRGLFLDLTAGIGLTEAAPDYTVGISLVARFDIPFIF